MNKRIVQGIALFGVAVGLSFLTAWIANLPNAWWCFPTIMWCVLGIFGAVIGCVACFVDYFTNNY